MCESKSELFFCASDSDNRETQRTWRWGKTLRQAAAVLSSCYATVRRVTPSNFWRARPSARRCRPVTRCRQLICFLAPVPISHLSPNFCVNLSFGKAFLTQIHRGFSRHEASLTWFEHTKTEHYRFCLFWKNWNTVKKVIGCLKDTGSLLLLVALFRLPKLFPVNIFIFV